MLRGPLHLVLLMGPVVPVPVPKVVVDALTEVTVTNAVGSASGFELKFSLSNDSVFTNLMLLLGQVGPVLRTILIVIVKGMPEVVIDGVVTQHQVSPDVETGRSTLTLTGSDLTAVLDWIDFTGIPYPAMPPEARVALIIAKYAMFGLIPIVIPRIMFEVPNPMSRIPSHQGKDLAYINQLAEEAGYTFFIEPGPRRGRILPTGGRSSGSARPSRHSTSTWMCTPMWNRSIFALMRAKRRCLWCLYRSRN
ncbi:hypothetical protein MELA_00266 [Candidatus Methylomirabilis lanthanidiphila]|uniref:Uncharacterized protein n=1 Tax=Candidatus Methylomirabilis lanthanidiphila TaxID=2211376 RepID=A0A564ZH85_9BACT|nr:hypothetical protein MELA_00266 [Candidatus Methylomirabilis lanthanidiphila]